MPFQLLPLAKDPYICSGHDDFVFMQCISFIFLILGAQLLFLLFYSTGRLYVLKSKCLGVLFGSSS